MGIKAASLEGYLFHRAYTFDSRTDSRQLIKAMADQCLSEMTPALLAKAKEQGLNRHQLLTLASIIQKEAGDNSEMPLISAVFHNRLRRGIALQADPTVIYGIENFDGNLTRRHLQEITPYNTYRVPGLPPGPIASPGRAALQAAANPAAVNYLYFVARGDGSHQFSNTLREHNAAVRRYQLKR
ncbi:MAG: endolytic transglycosylase MltG [Syntrophotaleaceae bacterium]